MSDYFDQKVKDFFETDDPKHLYQIGVSASLIDPKASRDVQHAQYLNTIEVVKQFVKTEHERMAI